VELRITKAKHSKQLILEIWVLLSKIRNSKGRYGLVNYGFAPTGTYIHKISFKKARDDE